MFRLMGALLDVFTSRFGKLGIPDKVLGTVQTPPVPVGAHDGADEVGIVLVGSIVFDEVARLDLLSGGCCRNSSSEGDESSDGLHEDRRLECRGVSRGSR